jgi:hypothetical protein
LDSLIFTVRGERVILDSDLASIYGVPTKRLNEQVRRNRERFPEDFCFRLGLEEVDAILSQTATARDDALGIRSQIATASKRNVRFLPYAFTEHGAIMAANVLNSKRAVQMSVFVVRAFVKMREVLSANKKLADKLQELEKKLAGRLDVHERAIVHILEEIKRLMEPPPLLEPKRRPIGFGREDE